MPTLYTPSCQVLYKKMKKSWLLIVIFWGLFVLFELTFAQAGATSSQFTIARLKYSGGGDWYNDPSILPNLLTFLRENSGLDAAATEVQVSIMDESLFSYPILFMTGHGRIAFTEREAERLRHYLTNGGFLFADDDYGMDEHFRREMSKVFPDKQLLPIPFSHFLFHNVYHFPTGAPKIHEHDGGPPQTLGYFHDGRLIVVYTFNTNISDGWADPEVHKDPPEVQQKALQMGANIFLYALMNE